LDGLFHGFEDVVALDLFFARDGVGDQEEFGAGNGCVHFVGTF
jgi:hypothetical protein